MVSMKDIAKRCGVSVASVSKALNDHSDISEATKKKILDTAKEMGYFPNSSARALKTNRTYNIGVLFIDEARNGLKQEHFSSMLDSFKVTAESRGYDITFINGNKNNINKMSYLEHAKYRGFDGVVIACVKFGEPEVQELIRSDIPVVTIDHVFDERMAIISDDINGMKDLVEYVNKMGHKKIAYIHGGDSSVTRSRLVSFYKTMENIGLEVPDEYIVQGMYRRPDVAAELTKKLMDLPDRPTCILFPDDYASLGGINAIKEMGLSIPEDVSIVGYDGIDIAKVIEPKITTLEQDTLMMGQLAAERLIALIEKPKTAVVERIIVPGKVFAGDSVKKLV